MQAPVPGVEVADDADRARRRRPHRERGAGDAVELAHVRAEPLVELLVAALADQVQVELAERRQERVRVVDRERCRPGRSRPRAGSAAAARRLRRSPSKTPAGVDSARARPARRRRACAVIARRRRAQRADRPRRRSAGGRRARVRVGVVAARRAPRGRVCDGHSGSSSRRAMPATGIATQSGRLSSS